MIIILLGILSILIFLILVEFCYENKNTIEHFFYDPSEIPSNTVHLFMAYDTHYKNKMGKYTSFINKKYAEDKGFLFHEKIIDSKIPFRIEYTHNKKKFLSVPHYARYLYLKELLQDYPDNHFFIYIDTDAMISDPNLDLRNWIPKNPTCVLFGNEINEYYNVKIISTLRSIMHNISFNSGVFIARNCNWTKNFINNVLSSPSCTKSRIKRCPYFDQSCITSIFNENKMDEKKYIKVIPQKKSIQNTKIVNNVPITHRIFDKNKFFTTLNPKIKNLRQAKKEKKLNYLLL